MCHVALPSATHRAGAGLCVLVPRELPAAALRRLLKQVRETPRADVCAKGWTSSAETSSAAQAGKVKGSRLTLIVLTMGWLLSANTGQIQPIAK